MTLTIGSLCSGTGALEMAVSSILDAETVWHADPDPGASAILAHHWPTTPNLGDITTIDWNSVPRVDGITGGYPCQPFSDAGKRRGTADDRHIWPHIATALGVLRPRFALFENVAGHLRRGFDTVLADLARLGFDAEWLCLRASDVGAAHQRNRLFILTWPADTTHFGREWAGLARNRRSGPTDRGVTPAHSDRGGRRTNQHHVPAGQSDVAWGVYAPAITRWARILGRPAPRPTDDHGRLNPGFVEWLMGKPSGHVTGVPDLSRAAQLHALGNGVPPLQAATAFRTLLDRAGPAVAS